MTDPIPGTAGRMHPRHRLDSVLQSPVRLSILACLDGAEKAEFGFVRDTVEVSDSVLSKQVATLEDAGYVKVKKGYMGKRPRTWLSISDAGRSALKVHLSALGAIASGSLAEASPGIEPFRQAAR